MANKRDSRSPPTSLLTVEARADSGLVSLERTPSAAVQPLAPKEYADAVWKHSQQTIQQSLYPGENFDKLALYLRKFVPSTLASSTSSTASPQKSPVDFVSSYIFSRSGKPPVSTEHIRSAQRLPERHDENLRQTQTASSQVLFLRGQPSSEWLATVGATYRVDPEFFQRHLDFYANAGRRNSFSLPSLSPSHIIEIHYTTIGEWNRPQPELEIKQEHIEQLRKACAESKRDYDLTHLVANLDSDSGLGKSIVREFLAFDEKHFAIEQRMTITVEKIGKEWAALVWTDTGKDLYEGPYGPGPWTSVKGLGGRWEPRAVYPTIQVQPHIALKFHRTNIQKSIRPEGKFVQSSSLLPLNYGRSLDERVAARDPFYAVSELFTFCAFSETQFLNMLESKLSSATNAETLSKRPLELSNLLYMQKAVKVHAERIRDNIETIKTRGSASWPRANDGKPHDKVEAVADVLEKQYEHMLRRAEMLSARTDDETRFLTNKALVDEAKRARDQAAEVTKLTRLAFFYIPLSFISSFFGMNLDPLTDARNSLWWFFVISVPTLCLSTAPLIWDIPELFRRFLDEIKKNRAQP
ncbi:hypothetical protein SLS56_006619 [Neofusicoccum ribis]|uniref:Uncharacterized protein n=1 Tax=Neofusicoccum ribis TaxID=45134 RepID=A0ABR3SQV4_9PEZI